MSGVNGFALLTIVSCRLLGPRRKGVTGEQLVWTGIARCGDLSGLGPV